MGLIRAITGAASTSLGDQWREFFYADALDVDTLAIKGQKVIGGKSSNTKGSDNIISNGSIIAVADGQCMIIVEQGKVVDICAEPGEFIYDNSTEPSLFAGKLSKSIGDTFRTIGKRFSFGGDTGKDQRVYYLNTKELYGNKYGTPSPVPFRVVDERAGMDLDISIKCFGEFSYELSDPILFYTNVCGNINHSFNRNEIDSQLKSELMTALQPAFAKISAMGIRYSALPGHTTEIAQVLNDILSDKWSKLRGIKIVSFGVSSLKASEEDEHMIKELQRNMAFTDPTRAAAHLVGAQATAMQQAASNEGAGAAMAFMGMNMAGNAGGMNPQNLFNMGGQHPNAYDIQKNMSQPATSQVAGMYQNGTQQNYQQVSEQANVNSSWRCQCGNISAGKFCTECGSKKPNDNQTFQCDKCGWTPNDPTSHPKFCPECGDIFDDNDKK